MEAGKSSWIRAMKSISRFIRIVRLLRILKIAPKLQDELGYITSQYLFTGCRLATYILLVIMLNHYTACLWCVCWSDTEELFDNSPNPVAYRYLCALHWCFSHCFLGSMDIQATRIGERLMTCIVLAMSFAIFSVVLSIICNDALELRRASSLSAKRYSRFMSFCHNQHISSKLVCRVLHFCTVHRVFHVDGQAQGLDMSSIDILPDHVRREITYELFWKILREHPFFRGYAAVEPTAVRILCQEGITVTCLFPDEKLVWFDSSAINAMIFVKSGLLYYVDREKGNVSEEMRVTLTTGMWAIALGV